MTSRTSTANPEQFGERAPVSVLFVCLGNICRSTMGEGVFRSLLTQSPYKELQRQGLIGRVDSCGTGAYHEGDEPDARTMATLRKRGGITDYDHRARKIHLSDFEEFDYILAMDRSNLRDLQRLQKRHLDRKTASTASKAKVCLFGEFGGDGEEVLDPYYGGQRGFEVAYEQSEKFGRAFLEKIFGASRIGDKEENGS